MESHTTAAPARPRLPAWIRVRVAAGAGKGEVEDALARHGVGTVCQGARCPNLGECWSRRAATFMLLGPSCTRDCLFCAVPRGRPAPPDPAEPARVAKAAAELGLSYVVVTMTTRDDLPDGGAAHVAATVRALRGARAGVEVEVLTSDLQARRGAIGAVLASGPAVFNHNIETVRRLSPMVRPRADYDRSLAALRLASELSEGRVPVKSGLMVGLGETDGEVIEAIGDIRRSGARMLTIGQYLPPGPGKWPLDRYVPPETFDAWRAAALDMGFARVASGPLVRSSYMAEELRGAAGEPGGAPR